MSKKSQDDQIAKLERKLVAGKKIGCFASFLGFLGVGPKGAALLKKSSTLQSKLSDIEKELQKVTFERDALSQSFKAESQVAFFFIANIDWFRLLNNIVRLFNYLKQH